MQREQSRLLAMHYLAVLGLRAGASRAKVKQAYRRLAKEYHPDVRPGDSAAEERFKEINEAYHFLLDNLVDKPGSYDPAAAPTVDFGRYSQRPVRPRRWTRRWVRPWAVVGIPVMLSFMVLGFMVERATRSATAGLADRERAPQRCQQASTGRRDHRSRTVVSRLRRFHRHRKPDRSREQTGDISIPTGNNNACSPKARETVDISIRT